jgi:SAM-dependent methyltransferase
MTANGVMDQSLAREWTRIVAPQTGDARAELAREAADFLGMPFQDAMERLAGAGERFRQEWLRTVTRSDDAAELERFYNESDAELFELIEWHASDPIHYRTLILRDFLARTRRPRGPYLDYGSGIGNDALVFAEAGYEVTLADVSEPLLAFAAWRCRRRGFAVRTLDLKRTAPPAGTFDLVLCFDVLEHVPDPLRAVRAIRAALRLGGVLAYHAPFGEDPEHPLHVVHRDVVTPRLRSLGFRPIACPFPPSVRAPRLYEKDAVSPIDRAGYYLYDNYLNNALGARLAAFYRRGFRRAPTARLEAGP